MAVSVGYPVKLIEYFSDVLFGNAYAIVFHLNNEVFALVAGPDFNKWIVWGLFDGVFQQIDDNILNMDRIGKDKMFLGIQFGGYPATLADDL